MTYAGFGGVHRHAKTDAPCPPELVSKGQMGPELLGAAQMGADVASFRVTTLNPAERGRNARRFSGGLSRSSPPATAKMVGGVSSEGKAVQPRGQVREGTGCCARAARPSELRMASISHGAPSRRAREQ